MCKSSYALNHYAYLKRCYCLLSSVDFGVIGKISKQFLLKSFKIENVIGLGAILTSIGLMFIFLGERLTISSLTLFVKENYYLIGGGAVLIVCLGIYKKLILVNAVLISHASLIFLAYDLGVQALSVDNKFLLIIRIYIFLLSNSYFFRYTILLTIKNELGKSFWLALVFYYFNILFYISAA